MEYSVIGLRFIYSYLNDENFVLNLFLVKTTDSLFAILPMYGTKYSRMNHMTFLEDSLFLKAVFHNFFLCGHKGPPSGENVVVHS